MRKTKRFGVTIIFAIVIVFIVFTQYLVNNINFLIPLMLISNSQRVESYALKRIFTISTKKDIVPKIIKEFEDGNHTELNAYYLVLLGAIGDKRALPVLTEAYVRCQDNSSDPKCVTIQYGSISAMGLIGDENHSFFIDTILRNYDDHHTEVRRQIFAKSLYLITGKKIEYINDDGVKRRLDLWESLVKARRIIEATKTKKRTVEEMFELYRSVS